jgi:sulfur carrier protein
MFLIVNGERRETEATRVDALLAELEYEGTHVAVAVNYDVVPRARWADTVLSDNDAVEILTPRQGG